MRALFLAGLVFGVTGLSKCCSLDSRESLMDGPSETVPADVLLAKKSGIRPLFWVPMVFVLTIVCTLSITRSELGVFRPSHWKEITFDGITLVGSPGYLEQVEEALALLKARSADEFAVVAEYVGVIEEGARSGMWAQRDPPTFVMSPKTAFYSVSWCAGSIAHDSYHSALYHRYVEKHGLPVPREVWSGRLAEVKCNAHQLVVLNKIGAPTHEIEHMASMDGTHFDLDGDGVDTWNDYRLRDW